MIILGIIIIRAVENNDFQYKLFVGLFGKQNQLMSVNVVCGWVICEQKLPNIQFN